MSQDWFDFDVTYLLVCWVGKILIFLFVFQNISLICKVQEVYVLENLTEYRLV